MQIFEHSIILFLSIFPTDIFCGKKHRRETLAERFPSMLTKKKKKERRIMKKIFYFKEISVSLLTVR